MSLVNPPLLTGDVANDIQAIQNHLFNINRYFTDDVNEAVAASPSTGWLTTGTSERKVLHSSDTLAVTQNVLATVITVLIAKGILSA